MQFHKAIFWRTTLRQAEGIAILRSKNNGKGIGRSVTIELDDTFKTVYSQWKAGEIIAVKAMELNDMTKATFYRKVKIYEEGLK